jgi:predicted nucleic acid-binding protein
VLREWAEKDNFVWLITEEILDEYKEVLRRLKVRPALIGKIINLLREKAEEVKSRSSVEISPDPEDDPFCRCAEDGKADFVVTLNPAGFPKDRLKASVLSPIDTIERR